MTASCEPSSNRPDSGQATVEFAIALGAVVVVIALMMQFLGVVNSQLDLELLAREGARAASRSRYPEQAARNMVAALDSDASVKVTVDGLLIKVTVDRSAPAIARITGNSEISATVVMAVEPP